MIRLAARLAFGRGREQLVRLAVSTVGAGLGVVLLLLAAVLLPAIRLHEARDAWTDTSVHNVRPLQDETRTDPLLWDVRVDGYDGRDIVRVDLAPLGPRAPLPPGLSRLPGPGELAVSPALSRLLRGVAPQQLADRFPGASWPRWATRRCGPRTRWWSSSATTRRSCAASPAWRRSAASSPSPGACR